MKHTLWSLLCALTLVSNVAAQDTHYVALRHSLDSLRSVYDIPELAVAVVRSDTVPFSYVCGFRNMDTKEPSNETDLFHIGSNTKAITSLVAATLIRQGKLTWSTKVLEVFPEAAETSRKAYRNITLADLLSHRAGIPPLTDQRDVLNVPRSTGSIMERRHAFALWLLKQRPVPVGPKEAYHYSNAGYGLAGALLERVTGKQWETLVRECLHDNLGIDVHFGWPNRVAIHEPWGHWEEADTIRPLPPNITYEVDSLIAPAGNVCMSIGEYAKFIQLQLRGLLGKTAFLPQAEFERMHYGRPEYGFGWGWADQHGNRVSFHDGSAGTFYCHLILSAKHDVAFIVCCNITVDDTDDQVEAIRHFLEGQQY